MRYKISQRLLSLTDKFTIEDESGAPHFHVTGKFFSWGDKLHLHDTSGEELVYIEQKLLSFMPRYRIFRKGDLFAEINQEFTWFKKSFTLDVPGPNDYSIKGSFWEYEFTFERRGRTVATVSKRFWSLRDTYGVDIIDGEDDVAILAAVIVVDMVCSKDRGSD